MDRLHALIYPYDNDLLFMFKYNQLNMKFNSMGAVAPKGWGLTNKNIGQIDGIDDESIIVKSKFEDCSNYYDCVVVADSYNELKSDIFLHNIGSEIRKGKSIMCLKELAWSEYEEIYDLYAKNGVVFEYIMNRSPEVLDIKNEMLLNINTPIILVSGIAERTRKFDLQLAIRNEIQSQKYKISQIGTKNYCEIFGFKSFPLFMYNSNISEANKIIMFNRYIKSIEINEKPDVILIGIPGGIMPINKQFTDGFGILNYLVSQAIRPDAVILNVLYDDYLTDYYNQINLLFKYKFGYGIDCFAFSNVKFDYQESKSIGEKCYTVIDSDFIDDKLTKYAGYEKPIYNISNDKDVKDMTNYIISMLSGDEYLKGIL